MSRVLRFIAVASLVIILPLCAIFLFILLIYKKIVCLSARIFKDFKCPIPSTNCIYLGDKIWTKPHSVVVQGTELQGECRIENIRNSWQRAYDSRDKHGQRGYRELGYYLVLYGGYGFWKKVPNFKHVSDRIVDVESKSIAPDEQDLLEIVQKLQRQPFGKTEPLWSVHLIHNYKGNPNRTIQLIRLHHLLADGMSFVKLFHSCTGSDHLPESFSKPKKSVEKWEKRKVTIWGKILSFLHLISTGFVDWMYEAVFRKDKHAINFDEHGYDKYTGDWIISAGKVMDLEIVKKASKFYKCSVMHILLLMITKGVERYYLKYHGSDSRSLNGFSILAAMPLPSHPNLRLVNHWTLAKMFANTGIRETSESLQFIKDESKRAAFASFPFLTAFNLRYIIGLYPAPVVNFLFGTRATSTVVWSNVPGPQDNRLYAGTRLTEQFLWTPIQLDQMTLATGIISCNGKIRTCITADVGCIPDQDHLDDLNEMIFDTLNDICKIPQTVEI